MAAYGRICPLPCGSAPARSDLRPRSIDGGQPGGGNDSAVFARKVSRAARHRRAALELCVQLGSRAGASRGAGEGEDGEEYFLAGDNRSLNDLFQLIAQLTGVKHRVRHLPFAVGKAVGAVEVA